MQQEDSAISGSGYGGDFFADAQVLEYSPFDEEENPEQGESAGKFIFLLALPETERT